MRSTLNEVGRLMSNVGRGWHRLIVNLHWELVDLAPNYYVLDIQSKNDELVFVMGSGDGMHTGDFAAFWAARERAVATSRTICETCGGYHKDQQCEELEF